MSMITKLIGNKNLSTFTKRSLTTPNGCFIDLSANYNVILVGSISTSPIFFNMDKGMRFMIAPTMRLPIVTSKVKIPGSLDFSSKNF